jgi:hypothetical protein
MHFDLYKVFNKIYKNQLIFLLAYGNLFFTNLVILDPFIL